ncbi:MAG: hypothetical protein PVH03_13065 [Chloroflexota bacterium]|jgi:hypothetical protein
MAPWWQRLLRIGLWLSLGVILGLASGLLLGWVVWPIEFTEADPTVLEETYQQDYTVMIATAYSLDQDLNEARQRLSRLGKQDSNAWLLSVTVDHILKQSDETEIRHLVQLANDLGLYSPAMDPYLADLATNGTSE